MDVPAGSLCDVLPAVAATLGVPDAPDRLGLRELAGDVDRAVVLLVDGMGLHLLPRMAPHAPLLASALAGGTGQLRELACTFPSTTPTSLVSLGTGVRPGEHGILGFTVAVPGTDRRLTHITWRDDPPPELWQPVPTWFQRAAAHGVDPRVVLPKPFRGSGLTDAAYRGARFVPLRRRDDPAQRILAELGTGPGIVYGYASELDTAAHVHGIASTQWQDAAREIDRLLTRLVEGLPRGAALVVTADHGGIDVPATGRVDLGTDARLREGVRVVAGEPRVRYVHCVPGATADVAAAWSGVLGGRARVLLRDQAVATGLFGPVPDAHLPRLGDVIAICTGDTVVVDTVNEPIEVSRLVGFHGADTSAETAIPLLVLRR